MVIDNTKTLQWRHRYGRRVRHVVPLPADTQDVAVCGERAAAGWRGAGSLPDVEELRGMPPCRACRIMVAERINDVRLPMEPR